MAKENWENFIQEQEQALALWLSYAGKWLNCAKFDPIECCAALKRETAFLLGIYVCG
jgi:hypothetical protein